GDAALTSKEPLDRRLLNQLEGSIKYWPALTALSVVYGYAFAFGSLRAFDIPATLLTAGDVTKYTLLLFLFVFGQAAAFAIAPGLLGPSGDLADGLSAIRRQGWLYGIVAVGSVILVGVLGYAVASTSPGPDFVILNPDLRTRMACPDATKI